MPIEKIKFAIQNHLSALIGHLFETSGRPLPRCRKPVAFAPGFLRFGLIALSFFLMMPDTGLAEDAGTGRARFSWEAVPDPIVAGYKVHWGSSSGNYTHTADAGNVTEIIITHFTEGMTYFAAVTAYDSSGEESEFSEEYSFVYTSNNTDLGTPEADPDGDGIPNLLESALKNGDPQTPNPGILPVSSFVTIAKRQYLALTVNKNPDTTGIDYAVEVSSDLLSWNSGTGHTVLVNETPEQLVVRDAIPLDSSTSRFLRLGVTEISP